MRKRGLLFLLVLSLLLLCFAAWSQAENAAGGKASFCPDDGYMVLSVED